MNIRGIYKTSLIDFPGKISTVLFSGGCNLNCGFCHNPDLVRDSPHLPRISNEEALSFLAGRKGLIDGVTLSGGEPTMNGDLPDFLAEIKKIPLEIKLDTNGLNPGAVERCLSEGLLDYAALDIKTSPDKYPAVTGRDVDFSAIAETLEIIRMSGIGYELRTTCVPGYAEAGDFREIGSRLGRVKRYYLQQFISAMPLLDDSYRTLKPYPARHLADLAVTVREFADMCGIRGV